MGLPSSPEYQQPLRVVAHAVRGYIDKLGPIWVEAQLIEINQGARSRLVFLTMRDTLAEVSVSARGASETLLPAIDAGLDLAGERLRSVELVLLRTTSCGATWRRREALPGSPIRSFSSAAAERPIAQLSRNGS